MNFRQGLRSYAEFAYSHGLDGSMKNSVGELSKRSKFLSWVLRHEPQAIGISLDPEGWVDVEYLLASAAVVGKLLTYAELMEVVNSNSKKRFELSADGTRIRAAYGHSIDVDLGGQVDIPPSTLFHGTARESVEQILGEGLRSQGRKYVHLSSDISFARSVGARHGKPIVLCIEAQRMSTLGFVFLRSNNGVWLTDQVPPEFLSKVVSIATDSPTTSKQP